MIAVLGDSYGCDWRFSRDRKGQGSAPSHVALIIGTGYL
jgi:hypothetical protein